MIKNPKVCVIVLSWNHKEDVLATVRSLSRSNVVGFKMEICLVDNASTDDTSASVEKFFKTLSKKENLSTKIIKNTSNLGFAAGNNVGMKYALDNGFDYVALLNDDTVVDRNLILNILKEHELNTNAGAISPKIYFEEGYEFHKKYKKSDLGKVIWYAGGKIDWDNVYGSNLGVDEVDRGQYNNFSETDFATGCFAMFKAKTLKDAGLYDERYFAYMEDADHATRIKNSGWKVYYSPSGYMWHKVAQSSGIGSGLNDYFLTRNRMLFGMTYAKPRTKFALIRESVKLLLIGRPWQKIGIRDYYLGIFGKGSWR